jgi:cytochrome P450
MRVTQTPPKLPGHPLLGHLVHLARDPFGLLERARAVGGVVQMHIPFAGPTYLVTDPDAIDVVLVKRAAAFHKDFSTRFLTRLTGNGLLTSEGKFWRRQRGLAQPAFHHKRLVSYGDTMVRLSREHAARLDGSIDVGHEMMTLTLAIVAETLFGADVSAEAHSVGAALDEVMRYYLGVANTGILLPLSWPTPATRRFLRAVAAIDEVVFRLIDEAKRRGEGERPDLLSMLLAARDEDGQAMDERQLRDEVVTLFLAGHETTALTLTWSLFLLSTNPAARARAVAEVDAVLGDRPATLDDLPKLRFVDAIVAESMRLYPPAWMIGREAQEDIELAGFPIAAKSQVYLSPWLMHRDARFFDEPLAFRPERWESGELLRTLPRFAYFPFGGGPRICIGNSFAKMEANLALATLLQTLDYWSQQKVAPGMSPTVTLRPQNPIRARVSPRRRQ